jgi:DNA-binding NarL/FixJ family response regulator
LGNRQLAGGLSMKAVTVSLSSSPAWEALSAQIQNLGIALTAVQTEADFTLLVDRLGHPPIVVYNPEGSHEALQVLEWARRHPVRLRVLVLVEKSDFAQYHECMHLGAEAYDEVSAEPKRIAKILRLAGEGGTD